MRQRAAAAIGRIMRDESQGKESRFKVKDPRLKVKGSRIKVKGSRIKEKTGFSFILLPFTLYL
jgi:hypothetical protein